MKNYTICDDCGEYGRVEIDGGWHCEECGSAEYEI